MLDRLSLRPRLLGAVLALLSSPVAVTACSGSSGIAPASYTPPTTGAPAAFLQSPAGLRTLSATTASPTVTHIYVADFQNFQIRSFTGSGQPLAASPEIDGPQNIVIDRSGNLFAANFGADEINYYTKGLKQKKVTIHLADSPVGLAVGPGKTGKLFATLFETGTVVTFDRNGKPAKPTINGPGNVTYVAVDSAGKIYVSNSATSTVTTYKPDGTPTTPTITAGLNGPGPLVVDRAGKIYVTNGGGSGSVTTYKPDGAQTTPTIPISGPHGIAVADDGNIYVTDSVDNTALTFKADGTPTTPTITGFHTPTGIAVLNHP